MHVVLGAYRADDAGLRRALGFERDVAVGEDVEDVLRVLAVDGDLARFAFTAGYSVRAESSSSFCPASR